MPDTVTSLVNRLGRTIHCLQYAEGLNPAQWDSLRFLSRANRYSRSPSALAQYLRTTKGTASQTLKSLESKGFVQRVEHPKDRRAVLLELTDDGRGMLDRDPLRCLKMCSEDVLGDDLETARDILGRLVSGLEKSVGANGFGICNKCKKFIDETGDGEAKYRCGLTGEPIIPADIFKICINHESY